MISKYFEINKNYNIRCKIYCNEIRTIDKVVLYLHGFGGHKDNKAAERFATLVTSKEKKTGIITFNWPCHGDDIKKKLKLSECDAYLRDVLEYIGAEWKTDNIYAYGTSFGGYMTLKYISENGNPFKKIAFRCPAINMYDVMVRSVIAKEGLEQIEKGKDLMVGFDRKILIDNAFLEELKSANIREREFFDYADDILIIHGTKDEIVPYEDSMEFCEDNVIEFVPMEAADHRFVDLDKMNRANHMVMKFLHN